MDTVIQILLIVLPLLFTGAIAVYVVRGMAGKKEQGTLGKKQSQEAQNFLDSFIPIGIFLGAAAGLIFGFFFSFPLFNPVVVGAGMGMLVGYFAYEHSSRDEGSHTS